MAVVVIVAGIAAAIGISIVFVVQRKHPENLRTENMRSSDVLERPAGPDAENMNAERPGGSVPPGPPAV